MSINYTPGKWEVVPGNKYHGCYIISEAGETICDLYDIPRHANPDAKPIMFEAEHMKANAALIAWAPAMHEALVLIAKGEAPDFLASKITSLCSQMANTLEGGRD